MYGACVRRGTMLSLVSTHSLSDIGQFHTNSTPIRCACYNIILELKVLVEDSFIELDLAVESISNPLPIRRRT